MTPLWIIGSGGHAKVVIDTARETGAFEILGCLDDSSERIGQDVLGIRVVGPVTIVLIEDLNIEYAIVAIGSNAARQSITDRIGDRLSWPVLVHPDASVAPTVHLGEGSVVFAGVVVQPDARIGRHVILNTSCSVDHDSSIGDFAHIGPGTHLAGDTTVGKGTFLGIGSRLIPGSSVGAWTIVGAGSTVIQDLPSDVTAVGTPAKAIKHSATNEPHRPMTALRSSPTLQSLVFGLAVGTCLVVIGVLRLLEPGPADRTLTIHGVYDALGHGLTALMIALGLRAIRLPIPLWSVVTGGVILDIGHMTNILDLTEAIAGSSRNGTHSVPAVILLALIGFLDRRHANVWLGIAIGATSHLWRDMGTGTVPLVWPITDTVYGTSFARYLAGLGGMAVAMIGGGALLQTWAHANGATSQSPEPRPQGPN